MEQRESDLAVVCCLAHEHLLADGPAGRNDVLRPKRGPLFGGLERITRSRPELRLLFLPLSFTACDAQSHSHAFLCPSTRETGCAELLVPGRAFRRRSREGPAHDHNL